MCVEGNRCGSKDNKRKCRNLAISLPSYWTNSWSVNCEEKSMTNVLCKSQGVLTMGGRPTSHAAAVVARKALRSFTAEQKKRSVETSVLTRYWCVHLQQRFKRSGLICSSLQSLVRSKRKGSSITTHSHVYK